MTRLSRSQLLVAALMPLLVTPPPTALAQKAESSKSAADLDGYSHSASESEKQWEEKFRSMPVIWG